MGKEVYNPEADRKAQEKFGSKNTKKPKAKATDKHPPEAKEEKPARGDKINKYGFFHLDKKLAEHLGVKFGKDKADVPVTIERIEGGFVVRLKV